MLSRNKWTIVPRFIVSKPAGKKDPGAFYLNKQAQATYIRKVQGKM